MQDVTTGRTLVKGTWNLPAHFFQNQKCLLNLFNFLSTLQSTPKPLSPPSWILVTTSWFSFCPWPWHTLVHLENLQGTDFELSHTEITSRGYSVCWFELALKALQTFPILPATFYFCPCPVYLEHRPSQVFAEAVPQPPTPQFQDDPVLSPLRVNAHLNSPILRRLSHQSNGSNNPRLASLKGSCDDGWNNAFNNDYH